MNRDSKTALFAALLVGCGVEDTGSDGDSSAAETSSTGDDQTSGTEATETMGPGNTCGLRGDACGVTICCEGLACGPIDYRCHEYDSETDGAVFQQGLPDAPTSDDCDIWNPGACPEGEKCTAYATSGTSWDANKCVMVQGNGQPGDDCTATDGNPVSGNDDCAKGSMCWNIDPDTTTGYCIEFCTDAGLLCTDDLVCIVQNDGVLPLCVPLCDPLLAGADCPQTGDLCIPDPTETGFVCMRDVSGGNGFYGAACETHDSCNQGLFCATAEHVPDCQGSDRCCSEFCEINQTNTCAGMAQGQTCLTWYEDPGPPMWDRVGFCGIL